MINPESMRRLITIVWRTYADEAVVEEEAEDGGAAARVVEDGLRHDLPDDAVHGGAAGRVEPRRELRVGVAGERVKQHRYGRCRRQEEGPSGPPDGGEGGHGLATGERRRWD
jgi:hypothetical protein